MKLQYLGTAAAEAVPAPFCQCAVCEEARREGGRYVRTRSQALVDDCLLIDLPPDTYLHTLREGLRLYEVEDCLITHDHCDHLYPAELECLMSWAAHRQVQRPFRLFGTAPVLGQVRAQCPGCEELEQEGRLVLREVVPFTPFGVGAYTVTALKADHGTQAPVVYMIEKGGKALLYAHDTGRLPQESLEYLEKATACFGLVSYDCTNGLLELDNRNHMGLTGDVLLREALRGMGRVGPDTLHVANHFSHNGLVGYREMEERARKEGFLTAYDGMAVEF